MTTLNDLNRSSGTTNLSSLAGAPLGGFQLDLPSSNINRAAQVAALGLSEDVEGSYRNVSLELANNGSSQTADDLISVAGQEADDTDNQVMKDILLDESLSDDQKSLAVNNMFSQQEEARSLRTLLANKTAAAPAGPENKEMEFSRINSISAIQEMNALQSDIQQLVNAEAVRAYPNVRSAVADVVEYMIPFYEGTVTAKTLADLKGGDLTDISQAFYALGHAKMGIREMVEKIPPNERYEFAQKIAFLVSESSKTNIVSVDENDMARMDALNTYLTDGYYDDADKWLDTTISILDLVGVGSMLRTGTRGARVARGARGATTAQPRRPNRPQTTTGLPEEYVAPGEDLGDFVFDQATGDWVRSSPIVREEEIADIVRTRRTNVQPTTVSQTIKDTNPSMARAMHKAAADDPTEEVAQAVYGASRQDAVVNDRMPEVGIGDEDLIASKISNPDLLDMFGTDIRADIIDFSRNTDSTHFFKPEVERMRNSVINDMEQAHGMSPRKEMFQYKHAADGLRVSAVYGPLDGAYFSGPDALELAKWSLRDYGIDDNHVKLVVFENGFYRPIGKTEAAQIPEGSKQFLVQIDFDYKDNPYDLQGLGVSGTPVWEHTEVKRNIFDRLGLFTHMAGQGSFNSHLVDIASMLDPTIVGSYFGAVDRAAYLEKRLLEQADGYARVVKKLPKDRQVLVTDYLKEANQHGLDFNRVELDYQGYEKREIEAIASFRDFWDTVYWLQNRDYGKTLNSRGYGMLVDEQRGTRLIAKPVGQGGHKGGVYDLDEGRMLTPQEIKSLYDENGTVAVLMDPLPVGDELILNVKVVNAASGNYLRKITDGTQVLQYRKGYFSVKYEDPWFIEKVIHTKDGPVFQAIGTAETAVDAQLLTKRFTDINTDAKVTFKYRPDKKKKTRDEAFNEQWQLSQARGFSAQRYRGERLQTTTSNVDDLRDASVMSPVDAMISTVRSTADRVVMRDVIDTHKLRVLDQLGDYMPKDQYGQRYIPSSSLEVEYTGTGQSNMKDLGAARSHVEYIRAMENGYMNAIDDTYRKGLKKIANMLGEQGYDNVERALRAASETQGPMGASKGAVFTALLVLNPARQIIVQSHQALQLAIMFPKWAVTRGPQELILMTYMVSGVTPPKSFLKGLGMSLQEAKDMYKQFDRSGLAASIDKQNLVRGALLSMADRTAGKGIPGVRDVVKFSRAIGFDAGEWINITSAWLGFRNGAIEAGESMLDGNVAARVAQQARNYTLGMNRAGDMAYNANALGLIMHFQQVPHKALTMGLTNRFLTPWQRLRYLGVNGLMLSVPAGVATQFWGDLLPDDHETTILGLSVRDVMINGIEGALLNKALSMMTGEETYQDWSSLSPLDMHGQLDFMYSLLTSDIGEILANTPAGTVLFGGNSRLTTFAKTTARYFNFIDDFEGEAGPTEFSQVIESFLKISSGYSSYLKAKVAFESGKKLNASGVVNDPGVTTAEALFTLAGFQTVDEAMSYNISDTMYSKTQEFRDDVNLYYSDLKKHVVGQGHELDSFEFTIKVMSSANLAFKGPAHDAAMVIIEQSLERDRARGDISLYNQLLKMYGIMSNSELENLIDSTAAYDPEKKRQAKEMLRGLIELEGL